MIYELEYKGLEYDVYVDSSPEKIIYSSSIYSIPVIPDRSPNVRLRCNYWAFAVPHDYSKILVNIHQLVIPELYTLTYPQGYALFFKLIELKEQQIITQHNARMNILTDVNPILVKEFHFTQLHLDISFGKNDGNSPYNEIIKNSIPRKSYLPHYPEYSTKDKLW